MAEVFDGQVTIRNATGTEERIVLSGEGSELSVKEGAQVARLRLKDRAGNDGIVIDGENSQIEGYNGGGISLRDAANNTRLNFDGSNGTLGVQGPAGSSVVSQRDTDDARVSLGTNFGLLIVNPDGSKRVGISQAGSVEIYDSAGNLTFKVNPETGDVSIKGSIIQL